MWLSDPDKTLTLEHPLKVELDIVLVDEVWVSRRVAATEKAGDVLLELAEAFETLQNRVKGPHHVTGRIF